MNKTDFLTRLEKLLKSLDKKERDKHLAYYGELIEDAMEDGCSEAEAVSRIGMPGAIAEEILEERQEAPVHTSASRKIVTTVLLILGFPVWGSLALGGIVLALALAVTAALCVAVAYMLIWLVPLVTGAVSLACLLLALISVFGALPVFLGNAPLGVVQFGVGILSAGIFILTALATASLIRYFVNVTASFTHWLVRVLKRKKEATI